MILMWIQSLWFVSSKQSNPDLVIVPSAAVALYLQAHVRTSKTKCIKWVLNIMDCSLHWHNYFGEYFEKTSCHAIISRSCAFSLMSFKYSLVIGCETQGNFTETLFLLHMLLWSKRKPQWAALDVLSAPMTSANSLCCSCRSSSMTQTKCGLFQCGQLYYAVAGRVPYQIRSLALYPCISILHHCAPWYASSRKALSTQLCPSVHKGSGFTLS